MEWRVLRVETRVENGSVAPHPRNHLIRESVFLLELSN